MGDETHKLKSLPIDRIADFIAQSPQTTDYRVCDAMRRAIKNAGLGQRD